MIKKMTTRAMNPETKNFNERTAHDQCSQLCRLSCKSDVPEIPEAQEWGIKWFPF